MDYADFDLTNAVVIDADTGPENSTGAANIGDDLSKWVSRGPNPVDFLNVTGGMARLRKSIYDPTQTVVYIDGGMYRRDVGTGAGSLRDRLNSHNANGRDVYIHFIGAIDISVQDTYAPLMNLQRDTVSQNTWKSLAMRPNTKLGLDSGSGGIDSYLGFYTPDLNGVVKQNNQYLRGCLGNAGVWHNFGMSVLDNGSGIDTKLHFPGWPTPMPVEQVAAGGYVFPADINECTVGIQRTDGAGGVDAAGHPMEVKMAGWFPNVTTEAQAQALCDHLGKQSPMRFVFQYGDSRIDTQHFWQPFRHQNSNGYAWYMRGEQGDTATETIAKMAADTANNLQADVSFVFTGTNSIQGGSTAQQVFDTVADGIDTALTAGTHDYFILANETPRSTGTTEIQGILEAYARLMEEYWLGRGESSVLDTWRMTVSDDDTTLPRTGMTSDGLHLGGESPHPRRPGEGGASLGYYQVIKRLYAMIEAYFRGDLDTIQNIVSLSRTYVNETSTITVPTIISQAAQSVNGTTLTAYTNQDATFTITPLDAQGAAIDATSGTFKVVIEGDTGTDITTVADGSLTKGNGFITFTIPAATHPAPRQVHWACRQTDDGNRPVGEGRYIVKFAADED